MKKFLGNLRLARSFAFISGLAALLLIAVGFVGYLSMKNINDNLQSVLKNNMVSLSRAGTMKSDFLKINLEVNKASYGVSDLNIATTVDQYKQELDSSEAQYKKANISGFEKDRLKEIDGYISEYFDTWKNVMPQVYKSEKLGSADSMQLSQLGSKIENTLQSLAQYNENQASIIEKQSKVIYDKGLHTLAYIIGVAFIVFVLLAVAITSLIQRSSKEMVRTLEFISSGDFSLKFDTTAKNEFGVMKKTLRKTLDEVSNMIKSIKDKIAILEENAKNLNSISGEMTFAAQNVSAATTEVASGTNTQAGDLVEVTAVLNEFGVQLLGIVKAFENVDLNSRNINLMTKSGNETMVNLTVSMEQISNTFKVFIDGIMSLNKNINKINEITSLINDISEQTNLLALNASIEAARAGEAGRGFAVVAEEVRKLAEQSKVSSDNISKLITGVAEESKAMNNDADKVKEEFKNQIDLINAAVSNYEEILMAINEIIPQIEGVNSSAQGLNKGKDNILCRLQTVAGIAQEASGSSQEISAAAEQMEASTYEVANTSKQLDEMAKNIIKEVNKFKL